MMIDVRAIAEVVCTALATKAGNPPDITRATGMRYGALRVVPHALSENVPVDRRYGAALEYESVKDSFNLLRVVSPPESVSRVCFRNSLI